MKMIWYTVLIRAVPEAMGEMLLTLALAKKEFNKRNLLLASVICGLGNFSVRMLNLKFGLHTLIGIVLQTLVIYFVLKVDVYRAFCGNLISIFILGLSEAATVAFMQFVLGLDPKVVYFGAVGTLLSSIPSLIILYLVAFIVFRINGFRKIRRKLCNSAN